jgi:anti-sigma factor RsiW
MPCLTPEQIEQLARDALPPADAEVLHGHVRSCPSCQRKMSESQANEDALRSLKRLPGVRTLWRSPPPSASEARPPA